MEKQRVDLAILVHDLSATGVVRNAMRIAGHGAQNGLKVELWVVSDQGAFRSRLPAGVGLRRFGGPMRLPIRRLETLAAALSEPRDAIEEIIEPFLIQKGFLQRTPRGRLITSHAFKHLGLAEPARDASQFGLFGGSDDD